MKVSVIIPVYNCGKYLEKCIDSMLNQTFQDFEVLLIDNGSVDESVQICKKYADKDSRIRFFQIENQGGAGAPRNKGIEEANGEYIIFVDADDYLMRDGLEVLVTEMESKDYDVVVAGYRNFSEDGIADFNTVLEERELIGQEAVRGYFARVYPDGEAGYLWNKIYKTTIIKAHNIRFPDTTRLEDGFFNVDYYNHTESCKVITNITYNYKLNAQTDLFRKSAPDYYKCITLLTQNYYDTIKQWGFVPQEVEGEMAKFFLNELEVCFENTMNPAWKMNGHMRKKYFMMLQEEQPVQYMLERTRYTGSFVKKVMSLFHSRHYRMMMGLIRLKLYMKKYMKGLYRLLKKREK